MTTSSPEESLASNLQFETVDESSARAISSDEESGAMTPAWKNVCRAERAADVIGPVDSGERMIAKKGARTVVRGIFLIPTREYNKHRTYIGSVDERVPLTSLLTVRLSELKPAISSRSLLTLLRPCPWGPEDGPDTRKPKLSASAESRPENAVLEVAQREFFRIVDVTAEISERRT
jgi:hypothetical protein